MPEPAALPGPAVASSGIRAAWRAAIYAFVLSRLIVVLAASLALAFAQQWPADADDSATLRLFTPEARAQLENRGLGNDAGWYLGIARHGYEQREFDTSAQANWAFFPLQPLLWRGAMALGLGPWSAGLLLANGFFLLALVQLHRWVQAVQDPAAATRAVLCVALFPTAYFFSLPWTESLFALLLASSLLAMEQRRWGAASAFAALASGSRAVGVLLAPVIWLRARQDAGLPMPRRWLLAALATTGLLVFMALLWHRTGNPLAFADIQEAWGRNGGSFTKHIRRWLADPLFVAEAWNLRWVNNTSALFGLAATWWLWRRGHRALSGFALLCLLLPWSTGTMISMGRYVMTCLPLFLALACWLARPERLLAWLLASAFVLAWMSAHFALGASFAGA